MIPSHRATDEPSQFEYMSELDLIINLSKFDYELNEQNLYNILFSQFNLWVDSIIYIYPLWITFILSQSLSIIFILTQSLLFQKIIIQKFNDKKSLTVLDIKNWPLNYMIPANMLELMSWIELFVNLKWAEFTLKKRFVTNSSQVLS